MKKLNAADDLQNGPPASTPSCPYNNNCAATALQALCKNPFGCALSDHLQDSWLSQNFSGMAAANCTNFYDQPCGTTPSQYWANENSTNAQPSPYMPGYDHTYDCFRGGDVGSKPFAHQPCMNIASTAFQIDDVESEYGLFGTNLDLNVTAILGIGNAYQRNKTLSPWSSPGNEYDFQILDATLPFRQNPAMLLRINLNLGGNGGWVGGLLTTIMPVVVPFPLNIYPADLTNLQNQQWNDPTLNDFALDNLFHYGLSDITSYNSSLFSAQWGQPHNPTSTDSSIKACNDIVQNHDRYDDSTVRYSEWCLEDTLSLRDERTWISIPCGRLCLDGTGSSRLQTGVTLSIEFAACLRQHRVWRAKIWLYPLSICQEILQGQPIDAEDHGHD